MSRPDCTTIKITTGGGPIATAVAPGTSPPSSVAMAFSPQNVDADEWQYSKFLLLALGIRGSDFLGMSFPAHGNGKNTPPSDKIIGNSLLAFAISLEGEIARVYLHNVLSIVHFTVMELGKAGSTYAYLGSNAYGWMNVYGLDKVGVEVGFSHFSMESGLAFGKTLGTVHVDVGEWKTPIVIAEME